MTITFAPALTDEDFDARGRRPHAMLCICGEAQLVFPTYAAAIEARRGQDFPVCGDESCFEEYLYPAPYGHIPVVFPAEEFEDESVSVDVSSSNAIHLLGLLGILEDAAGYTWLPTDDEQAEQGHADDADADGQREIPWSGELPAEDFLGRALVAAAFAGEGDDAPARFVDVSAEGGRGPRMLTQLRDGRYDARLLGRLAELARWCADRGRAVAWA
jgi:hypothetical protein